MSGETITTATPPVNDLIKAIELESLAVLIHAGSKKGKSTLALTSPKPILVLDAEGGWKFMRVRKRYWDPLAGGPPKNDGTWDVCIVVVRTWDTVQQVFQYLVQTPHQFMTIVIDSVTEVQRRCRAQLKGTTEMKIQDWGTLLTQMDATIRGYRDLALQPNLTIRCVVFIAETRLQDGKYGPYMQGQISTALPYWMDIVGYLYVDTEQDENGQPTQKVRKLLIGDHPQFVTGERVQGQLPDVITRPNLADMYRRVYEPIEEKGDGQLTSATTSVNGEGAQTT